MASYRHGGERLPSTERKESDATAEREAYSYWGYLLKADKTGTPMFDRLLSGIADHISKTYEPGDSSDLLPSQIAAWYRAVGGGYHEVFVRRSPAEIAFIYRELGVFYSLQTVPESDKYFRTSIPTLKKQGFITWQTIQLLLKPQEHGSFLQKTLELFDIVDPETEEPFEKMLPSTCFPDKPDEAMWEWYEDITTRLSREYGTGGLEARAPNSVSKSETCVDNRVEVSQSFADHVFSEDKTSSTSTHHVPDVQAGTKPLTKRRPELDIWRSEPPVLSKGSKDSFKDSNPNMNLQIHSHVHKQLQPTRKGGHMSTTDSGLGIDAGQLPSIQRTSGRRRRSPYILHPSSKKYTSPQYQEQSYKQGESDEESNLRTSNGPHLPWWFNPDPTTAPTRTVHVEQMQTRRSARTAQNSLKSSQPLPAAAPNIISATQSKSTRLSYHDAALIRHTPHQHESESEPEPEQEQEQEKHQEIEAYFSSASWASRADLQRVSQSLGYPEQSPESAVLAALLCGKEEDATLLLQLDAPPLATLISSWKRAYLDSKMTKIRPYLRIWQRALVGRYYDTLEHLLGGDLISQYKCFTSLTWEWTASDISIVDVKYDVVLTSWDSMSNPGELQHVQATTYQEYFASSRWSGFVLDLIEILNKSPLCSEHQGFSVCAQKVPLVKVTCLRDKLSIDFGNECHAVFDLIKALDWLCKTLSSMSAVDGHSVSSATYHAERRPTVIEVQNPGQEDSKFRGYTLQLVAKLRMSPLKRVHHDCWLSLFDAFVVVSMPSPDRLEFGKGLCLSFDLMLSLAAVEFCVAIDGGIVFLGYQTALYPVTIQDGYAQFHLITSSDGQINPYKMELPNRLLTHDSSQFGLMRCYVGWCEAAHVNLGTRQLSCNVGYSGGRIHARSLQSDGYAILGQFGASNPLSSIVGLQKNFRYTGHRVRFTPTSNYLKLLHDTSRQSVVLYDAGQHRCWLVPKLSALLHMSQIYASRCATAQSSGVPYVEPHNDAADIIAILESKGDNGIFGAKANDVLLRELFLALSINLLSTAEVIKDSESGKLYGFELMDVVHEPGKGTCMKRLDIKSKRSGWLDLVNAVGNVIVCSELGEAISPAKGNTRKNSVCNELPQSLDYLAATLPCLSRLLEQKGVVLKAGCDHVTISDKTVWKLTEDAFTPCPHSGAGRESCWERPGLIQQMARSRWYDRPKAPHPVRAASAHGLPTNGAVVFG